MTKEPEEEQEYSEIEVDLSEQDRDNLVIHFVQTKLSGASQSIFNQEILDRCIEDALYCAIVNEMIVIALTEEVEMSKGRDKLPHVFMTESELERQNIILDAQR